MEGPDVSEAALRALVAADEQIEALSRGSLSPEGERQHILRVSNAVDRALRRLLRDDERAEISLRLKALAPDEIAAEAVLSELRRVDRLPVETAAAIHELFEIRRGLEGGAQPGRADGERAVRAARGLEQTIRRPPVRIAAATPEGQVEEADLAEEERLRGRLSRSFVPRWALAAVGILLVAGAAAYALIGRGPNHMEQGVALFRSGAYAEAAHHFWRYAEANEDDATPHLYLARIHRRMNRPELAAESIREAQRLAPEDAAVHRELGFFLLDTGRADLAVERFNRALELDRSSSEGWVGLVRALRESGRGPEAENAIAEAPAEVRALLSQPGTS